jgi:ribonucleoside-diphosphate reductase beta chain
MSDSELQLNDPQTLYRRWEDSQWSPFAIDLSRDGDQWATMSGDERDVIFFVLSSLLVAEERITTKFSGLVGTYGSEEEATFLSTQQVDEARHMQFYARFQDEVVAAPDVIGAHVERARANVSDAFRHIFDEELVQAHERLVAEPRSFSAKLRFITLYHLILEATLGLTTFKFTTGYLSGAGLLPGFVDGYSKIHHDETRHIGFGLWFLRESVAANPGAAEVVRQTLRDLLPSVAASLAPPDTGSERDFAAIGATTEQIREFALAGLTRRLDIIGVPLATL